MKHTLLFVIIFLSIQETTSQSRFSLRPEAGAGVLFHRFTKDSLVPTYKKGEIQAGGFSYINVLADYKARNNKWHFLTGLGFMTNSFKISKAEDKTGLIELLTFAWLWDDPSPPDPYPYNKITLKNKSITVPIGFTYNLSKKDSSHIQTLVGLRAQLNFIVNKRAFISFVGNNATNDEKIAAQKQFTSLVNPFTVSLMPTISFLGKPGKKLRWDFTIIPFILYTEGQVPRIYTPEKGFNFSIGASYSLQ